MPGSSRTAGSTSGRRSRTSPRSSPRSCSSTAAVSGPTDMRQGGVGSTADAGTSAGPYEDTPVDATELLLWALMRKFERLALERYAAHAPMLATADKRRFVACLDAFAPDENALATSSLAAPVDALLLRA